MRSGARRRPIPGLILASPLGGALLAGRSREDARNPTVRKKMHRAELAAARARRRHSSGNGDRLNLDGPFEANPPPTGKLPELH